MSPDDASGEDSSLRELLTELARAPELDPQRPRSPLAAGARVGRFELLRELGVGSFGVVFEARDTGLGRHVAIKVLRADRLGPAGSRERAERLALFRTEAETSAKLHHPNLITLYDFGVEGDQPYLVLELLKGETLDARLARGPLPPAEALRVTADICRALVHAHAAGVMHGDLSLANVMLREDGTVKVLDLGLSRLFGGAARGGGTPGFIAPEKLLGDPADARSDVYSTGVLLFCLLRGERKPPKTAPLSRELADEARRSLPAGVARLVARAIHPQAAERQQSAGELLDSLEQQLRTPAAGASRRKVVLAGLALLVAGLAFVASRSRGRSSAPHSIAVLPFVDLSEHKDQEYFADGIAEEILDALANVDGLRVIARTSSFSFKGKSEDLRTIGQLLGAANVLEGSVRKEGNHVRITAQLVSASEGVHLWSQTFDRDLTSALAVQGEIAQAVAGALRLRLLPGQAPGAVARKVPDPRAFDEYLIGRRLYYQLSEDGYRRAIDAFHRALAIEPSYAPAWAGVALAEHFLSYNWVKSATEVDAAIARSREAAERAIALAPDLADGYLARAHLRATRDWDWAGALADSDRALELRPGHAEALTMRARWILAPLGRFPEALAAAQQATELDPLNARVWTSTGAVYLFAHQWPEARRVGLRALEISPGAAFPPFLLAFSSLMEGQPARALQETKGSALPERWRLELLEHEYRTLGQSAMAQQALDTLIARHSHDGAYNIAAVWSWRGDRDRAFDWLERAVAQREVDVTDIRVDPALHGLDQDPRWRPLLRRLNLDSP